MSNPFNSIGIVALAPLRTAATRTLQHGSVRVDDVLCMTLGLQAYYDQLANPHSNEYLACAAMTTGYVFRVENVATVAWLQRMGETGAMTTVQVREDSKEVYQSSQALPSHTHNVPLDSSMMLHLPVLPIKLTSNR